MVLLEFLVIQLVNYLSWLLPKSVLCFIESFNPTIVDINWLSNNYNRKVKLN